MNELSSNHEPPRSFMVEVSAELLAQLREWSRPLEVRVEPDPLERGGYRMTFREPNPPVSQPVSKGRLVVERALGMGSMVPALLAVKNLVDPLMRQAGSLRDDAGAVALSVRAADSFVERRARRIDPLACLTDVREFGHRALQSSQTAPRTHSPSAASSIANRE